MTLHGCYTQLSLRTARRICPFVVLSTLAGSHDNVETYLVAPLSIALRTLKIRAGTATNNRLAMRTHRHILKYCIPTGLCAACAFAAEAAITGQGDFKGSLEATIGLEMSYLDSNTQNGTLFGSTASFGIASIGGQVTNVMQFPRGTSGFSGYSAFVGASPNGGGNPGCIFGLSTTGRTKYTLRRHSRIPDTTSGFLCPGLGDPVSGCGECSPLITALDGFLRQ